MLRKFVLHPSCVNVVLSTGVNVVNATVLVQFQFVKAKTGNLIMYKLKLFLETHH